MSQATAHSAHGPDAHGHGHHDPNLAHHFDSMSQQVASGKLGMWVFLATELLMFGGLFCAYAIWRANHYDQFTIGFQYLETKWGAINTVILIASSFTMAWAVRTAQLNKQRATVILLGLTLLGGFGFMGIKAIEYSHKYELGVFIGPLGRWDEFYVQAEQQEQQKKAAAEKALAAAGLQPQAGSPPGGIEMQYTNPKAYHHAKQPGDAQYQPGHGGPGVVEAMTGGVMAVPRQGDVHDVTQSLHGEEGAVGAAHADHSGGDSDHDSHSVNPAEALHARTFFSIYFLMTGLHGLHVLIGMGLIAWIMLRAARGEFTATYNAPVDLVGLYWHLVDLIWIFLFPLLYLIK